MGQYKKLWYALIAVLIVTFSILGYLGTEVYRQAPPFPDKYVTAAGETVITKEDILAADTFFVRDGKFTVSEMLDVHLPERAMQAFADSLCEVTGVGSREDGKRRISTHPFSGL